MEQDDWRQEALCAAPDPDDWYADEHTLTASIAAGVCFSCPVRKECLKEACDNKEIYGIWGGLPASMRLQKGRVHNFLKLVDLPDPYETMDGTSPFHISNWLGGPDE